MATRRPIVLVSGISSELPVGDVIDTGLDVTLQPNPSGLYFTGDNKLGFDGQGDNIQVIASGVGAVYRTVQDKGRDIVSVKDFGAVGDGITDDTAAIQAAITAAKAAGKHLFFGYNVEITVPAMATTLQDVFDILVPGEKVTINIQSGYTISAKVEVSKQDYSSVTLTSVDSEVSVDASSIPAGEPVFLVDNATGPVWDIILDCDKNADYGLKVDNNSSIYINPSKGVRNASDTNIFVHHGSKLACPSSGVNGLICTGAGILGIWVTYASSVTTYYADLTGNGLDDPTNGYAAFISRGCHVQFDRADFSNSAGGIRNARSIVTARQAVFDSIPNYSIWQFEQGFVNASAGTFTNCGTAVTKPVLVVGVSATRPQGGGTINAENCSFIGINGDIGQIYGGNGTLILDNITATGLVGKIAVITHGTLECKLGSITADATNTQTELVLASRGAKAYLHGGVYDGSSAVRNVARFIEDSFGAVEGLTATNFTENNLARFEESGKAYGHNSTVNGSSNVYARGTNANGEFVRYVDGKQECWRWLEVNTVVSPTVMTAVWTFPVAFFNTQTTSVSIELSRRSPGNVVNTSTSAILPDVQIIQDSVSASVVSLQLAINSISAATFTAGNTVWVKLHAVGWWY